MRKNTKKILICQIGYIIVGVFCYFLFDVDLQNIISGHITITIGFIQGFRTKGKCK